MAKPPINPCITCPHYMFVGCNLPPDKCISLDEVKKFAVAFAKFREREISSHLQII